MANRSRPKKRREDECLDSVAEAVRHFDGIAPAGTYKMDLVAARLVERHGASSIFFGDTPRMLRWRVKHSFGKALNRCRFDIEFPGAKRGATEFFHALGQMRQLAAQITATEFESFSSLLITKTSPFDDAGELLDPGTEIEGIEEATKDLLLKVDEVTKSIDYYIDDINLPDFPKQKSNRTIRFTYYLISDLALGWTDIFGRNFESPDLPDMTELVAAGLEDFRYPLNRMQRQSNVWLSDRIRKQVFRN